MEYQAPPPPQAPSPPQAPQVATPDRGFPLVPWPLRTTLWGLGLGLLLAIIIPSALVAPFDPDLEGDGALITVQGIFDGLLVTVALGVASAWRFRPIAGALRSLGLRQFKLSAFGWMFAMLGAYYLGAVIFSALGIYFGLQWSRSRSREVVVVKEVRVPEGGPFVLDTGKLEELGITPREHEILGLIAEGLSNREIGERLFVSENTVKTHSSRLFAKLEVQRRTQAIAKARDLCLIP